MNLIGLEQVVRDVFGPVKTEVIGGWLSMKCPLAQWTHESGRDSRASFGLSINDNVSIGNCFTCSNKMPLGGILRKWANYTGEDIDSLIEEIEEQQYLGPRELPEWGAKETEDPDPTPLKKSVYLELYDSAAGHPYVFERGISDATVEKLQLMVDPCDPADGEERILFPVFGPNGDLYGLTGRATHPDAKLKVRDYFGLKKAACLLGAHLITQDKPKFVLPVEGLFDYANMWEQGFPAVAVMHSTLTPRQAAILRSFGLPTYLFYDNDVAGQKGVENAGKLLYDYLPVMKVRYPKVWIDTGSEYQTEETYGEGHYVKDPGELLHDEIAAMVDDARLWFPS